MLARGDARWHVLHVAGAAAPFACAAVSHALPEPSVSFAVSDLAGEHFVGTRTGADVVRVGAVAGLQFSTLHAVHIVETCVERADDACELRLPTPASSAAVLLLRHAFRYSDATTLTLAVDVPLVRLGLEESRVFVRDWLLAPLLRSLVAGSCVAGVALRGTLAQQRVSELAAEDAAARLASGRFTAGQATTAMVAARSIVESATEMIGGDLTSCDDSAARLLALATSMSGGGAQAAAAAPVDPSLEQRRVAMRPRVIAASLGVAVTAAASARRAGSSATAAPAVPVDTRRPADADASLSAALAGGAGQRRARVDGAADESARNARPLPPDDASSAAAAQPVAPASAAVDVAAAARAAAELARVQRRKRLL